MRPDRDTYFMRMAKLISTRSTCTSRQVGCVLVNHKNHVIATGYNGVPSGLPHCYTCAKREPGKDLDRCMAVHAEMNALLQCGDVYEIDTIYCTDSPCIHCVKLLMNTSCKRIVYGRDYPGHDFRDLWASIGREMVCYGTDDVVGTA